MSSAKNDSQLTLLARAFRHYSLITSRVLAANVGVVILFGVPGYFLDQWLGTWPDFFVVGIVLALPLSQVLVLRSMREYLNNNPQD